MNRLPKDWMQNLREATGIHEAEKRLTEITGMPPMEVDSSKTPIVNLRASVVGVDGHGNTILVCKDDTGHKGVVVFDREHWKWISKSISGALESYESLAEGEREELARIARPFPRRSHEQD